MDVQYSSESSTEVKSGSWCVTRDCNGKCSAFITSPAYKRKEERLINVLSSCRTRCVACGFYQWKCAICAKFGYKSFIKSRLARSGSLFRDIMIDHINKKHSSGDGDSGGAGRVLPIEDHTIAAHLILLEGSAVFPIDFTEIIFPHPHIAIMHLVDYDTIIHSFACLKLHIDDHLSTLTRTSIHGNDIVRLRNEDIQQVMNMLMGCNWECGICGGEFDELPSFEVFMDHYASHAV